jgi:hypothetical protein
LKSMKTLIILPIALFVTLALHAQDYVITAKRDTLVGEVKPILYGAEKKVQITTADKKKSTFPITQTSAYLYKGERFEPVRTDKGYTFMKVVKPGYLTLYAFQMENQMTFDGLYLVKRDGTRTEVPNLSFKKVMTRFLADCSSVSTRIDQGDLSKKDLNEIVDEYNLCISSRTQDASQAMARRREQIQKASPWDDLENKVKAEPDFNGKKDALDMIAEIKTKIARSEKVPNFMLEGLKSSLAQPSLKEALDAALKEIQN